MFGSGYCRLGGASVGNGWSKGRVGPPWPNGSGDRKRGHFGLNGDYHGLMRGWEARAGL